jgi:hypothetical protein
MQHEWGLFPQLLIHYILLTRIKEVKTSLLLVMDILLCLMHHLLTKSKCQYHTHPFTVAPLSKHPTTTHHPVELPEMRSIYNNIPLLPAQQDLVPAILTSDPIQPLHILKHIVDLKLLLQE